MANTPLHVAASHNRVEVVKFLLNFAGPETVDLEAKNMVRKILIHMEKLLCTWLLKTVVVKLQRFFSLTGLPPKPKQMYNGMTPLHLSVWHSLRAEDNSTVKTLLEHNADCSAKDDVLMTGLTFSYGC
ncbi:putative ankyrin repeat-containing domain-containing protein [Helianthus anomalus]